jgi:hypothetical protein
MVDRRIEERYLCADLVRVDWLSGEEIFTTVDAVLEDISPNGACIQLEGSVPVGSAIAVSAGTNHFTGFVSYCVRHEHGYFVGICLSDESKWSKDTFVPQHLTNVRAFMGN